MLDMPNGLAWSPCIENLGSEDAIVTRSSYDKLMYGDFNRVPILAGFNSLEGRSLYNGI